MTATPVVTYQATASAPAFVPTDCTDAVAKSELYALGDTVIADGIEYFVAKTVSAKTAQVCPTDAEAAKTEGVALYGRAPLPVATKDLTEAQLTARAAPQTKCKFASAGYNWF